MRIGAKYIQRKTETYHEGTRTMHRCETRLRPLDTTSQRIMQQLIELNSALTAIDTHHTLQRQYLWLTLMDLHSSAHCGFYIVPLRFGGIKYLHGMGPTRDLEPEIPGVHDRERMFRTVIKMRGQKASWIKIEVRFE